MELKTVILGTRKTIAGSIYGTIVVLSVVTAGANAFQDDPWGLALVVGVTSLVFWAAHVYSQGIGQSLNLGRRLTYAELGGIAGQEASILFAAMLPLAAIVLGGLGAFSASTAFWLAVGVGAATLTAQGVRYARLERLSALATILTVAINLALGLVIVAVKALLAH